MTKLIQKTISKPCHPKFLNEVRGLLGETLAEVAISRRDKDLKGANFFEADKFPEITFKSTSIKPSSRKDVYDVTGDLTMRGVTKRVTIPVEFNGFGKDPWGNERAGFSLTTTVNRKDYGINWNKALDNGGFLLSDDVTINVNLEAQKAK